MNITKQIEVQSKQEEPQLDDLLHKRKDCMDRIDKCNALILKKAEELRNEGFEHIMVLLQGDVSKALNDTDFQISKLVQTNQELLKATITIDTNAIGLINKQKEEYKNEINAIRFAKNQ